MASKGVYMRLRILPAALSVGLLALAAPGIARPPEYRAKAEYLLHFLAYVTWPAAAFPSADSPLVIGVLGSDPFGALLDSACSGAVRQGRRIRARRVTRPEDAGGLHVVFISRGDPRLHEGWIGALGKLPILTVVEAERDFAAGAMIRLDQEAGRIRFDVNLPILRYSGLRIGAPMLVSARRVIGNRGSG